MFITILELFLPTLLLGPRTATENLIIARDFKYYAIVLGRQRKIGKLASATLLQAQVLPFHHGLLGLKLAEG